MIKKLMVQSKSGQLRRLANYSVTRQSNIEMDKVLKVIVEKDDSNVNSYPLVDNFNYLIYEGTYFVITNCKEKIIGDTVGKELVGILKASWDLEGHRIYETITGTYTIESMLTFGLKNSGYDFIVDKTGITKSLEVENYGDDSSFGLLKYILNRFECECEIIDKTVYVAKQIGRVLNKQIRHQYNVKDAVKEMDTSNFFTHIEGFGAIDEKTGKYIARTSYTSPLATELGIYREAPPVRDETYRHNDSLYARLVRELNDKLNVSIQLTATELAEMNLQDIRKGDWIFVILEPLGIDVRIRVIEIEDYSNEELDPVFTFGTARKSGKKIISNLNNSSQLITSVIDERGRIKTQAIDQDNLVINLEKAKGQVREDQVVIGPETKFAEGYDPSHPNVPLANALQNGLMSANDFIKLARINVDDNGNVQVKIPLASSTNNGLFSSSDFTKLNRIKLPTDGQVIDLSIFIQKINELEEANRGIKEQINNLEQRVELLEQGGGDNA